MMIDYQLEYFFKYAILHEKSINFGRISGKSLGIKGITGTVGNFSFAIEIWTEILIRLVILVSYFRSNWNELFILVVVACHLAVDLCTAGYDIAES